MAVLENAKHEKYARMRCSGMAPSKAAVAAGYAPGSSTSSKLEADPDIVSRMAEIMEEKSEARERQKAIASKAAEVVGEVTGYSHSWVLQRLADNAVNAAQDGDFKESNAALKLIGEHLGMWGGNGGQGESAVSPVEALTDHAFEKLEKLNSSLAHLDEPEEMEIPDAREIAALIGKREVPKKVELLTNSETDVALTNRAELEDQ